MHILNIWKSNHSMIPVIKLGLLLCIFSLSFSSIHAQGFERMSDLESETFAENAFVNGDYEAMKNIRRYWQQETQRLRSLRQVEFNLTGSNEAVLKVTIPSRLLFNQNDTTLVASAEGTLRPFLKLLRGDEAVATLIIAAHTDNNGSAKYLSRLSTGRSSALHRWFARQGVGPANLHSFGFANKVSRNSNSNIREREKNRRICLYFIPNKKMLKSAKKGTL